MLIISKILHVGLLSVHARPRSGPQRTLAHPVSHQTLRVQTNPRVLARLVPALALWSPLVWVSPLKLLTYRECISTCPSGEGLPRSGITFTNIVIPLPYGKTNYHKLTQSGVFFLEPGRKGRGEIACCILPPPPPPGLRSQRWQSMDSTRV